MSVLNAPYFHDEEAAFAKLESIVWPDGPVCPHCGALDRIYALKGVRSKPSKKHPQGIERFGLKKCGHCRKQFTARVGTVFESSHIPLHKWFQAAHLLCSSKKGISSHQLHRVLKITYEAAWFASHRLREAMRAGPLTPMGSGGVVEIDETTQGRQAGAPSRKELRSHEYGGWAFRNVVFSLVERGGNVRSFHVSGTTIAELMPIIRANISHEAQVMMDAASSYKYMNEPAADGSRPFASHDRIDHSQKEYARYELGRVVIHTNTVERYFSLFKRGMRGVYQHCSEKHLRTAISPSSTSATTIAVLLALKMRCAPKGRCAVSRASA